MFEMFRPADENGVPRRFRGHREAFVWVAASLVKMCVPRIVTGSVYALAAWLAWLAARFIFPGFMPGFFPGGREWIFVLAMVLLMLITLLVLGSGLIYAYLELAGGVMRRDEREDMGGR